MAPFDGACARRRKARVAQVNAKRRRRRPAARPQDLQHAGRQAGGTRGLRAKLIGEGANIIFTTCDVDLAAPVVQEAINRGLLAIAPCIGTDQMGPKRFGAKGKLAFSFGNVAQDEGSAMAQYAWGHGWKTADARDRHVIVYFKNDHGRVRGALQAARRQDRRLRDATRIRPSAATTSRTPSAGDQRARPT